MPSRERVFLGGSLLLNVVLLGLLFLGGRDGSPAETDEVAAAEPTKTPLVITVVASPTERPARPTPTPTAVPTNKPTPTATPPATPTPSPSATPTDLPTSTPPPTDVPTPTPTPAPGSSWLTYLNAFRQQASLFVIAENSDWSLGAGEHSVYMVNTGQIRHSQDPKSDWFTEGGDQAAKNGNLYADSFSGATFRSAIDYWMSATFHALPILDPELQSVGFGFYLSSSGSGGGLVAGATLDIRRGLAGLPDGGVVYPLTFPQAGGQTWVLRNALVEFPDPLESCSGYSRPTGPPLIVQIGSGSLVPQVSAYSLRRGDTPVDVCLFTETTYRNANSNAESTGRTILDQRDAVVLLPRQPLLVGNPYTASVTVNGTTITWQFEAVSPPQ
ncbi:MAG: CAP domain-containing protein [Chloroflexi bacterium]|nr:CAP domain-containing protein [Chloroflexota bacterium]MCI0729638.1 CAP domain-containing protein [Chloroflexota bacterium]